MVSRELPTPCPHDGRHPTRGDDGVREIDGRAHRTVHPSSGYVVGTDGECVWRDYECEGLVFFTADVIVEMQRSRKLLTDDRPTSLARAGYGPCPDCRPGVHAVFAAGLWRPNWNERDHRARALFKSVAGTWPIWHDAKGNPRKNQPREGDIDPGTGARTEDERLRAAFD